MELELKKLTKEFQEMCIRDSSRDAVEEKELPETADRIHKPSILERLKQEKAQQNTAEQPPVQKTAKKKHEQEL